MGYARKPRIQYVSSPTDIDWNYSRQEQLEPQLYGGPNFQRKEVQRRSSTSSQTDPKVWMTRHSKPSLQEKNSPSSALSWRTSPVTMSNWVKQLAWDPQCNFIGSVSSSSRWWSSFRVEIGKMRPNSNTWCRFPKSIMKTTFQNGGSSSSGKRPSKSSSSSGKLQQQSGKAVQYWASWQMLI